MLNRINKLKKTAARLILNEPHQSPSFELFQKLQWLTVYEQLQQQKAVTVYKSLNNLYPQYMKDLFHVNVSAYDNLRSSSYNNLQVPFPRTETFKKSLTYSGPLLWNSLPESVKNSNSVKNFKHLCSREVMIS